MHLSNGVTPFQSVASWAYECVHPLHVPLPPHTSTFIPPLYSSLKPCVYPLQAWTGVCHVRNWCVPPGVTEQTEETAKKETKLAAASVSRVASPWVRWAILIEGRERSLTPLVHKPLYRIPHHVLMASLGLWGRCYPMTSVTVEEEVELYAI